jgi:competence protein ComEA
MDRLNEILRIYKYPLLIGLVGFILLFSGTFSSLLPTPQAETKELPKESLTSTAELLIKVDIGGAVNKPGVYELQKDKRIDDLLKEAGGFTPDANAEFISKGLNLSQKLSDGQKIYIPFKGESAVSGIIAGVPIAQVGIAGKINLNTAPQAALEELPGIGPSTASKIIAARPISSLNELVTKKVVGKATYDKIKDQLEI